MVWALGQAITAGWLEPLGPMGQSKAIFSAAWRDEDDLFDSSCLPGMGDNNQYVLSVTVPFAGLPATRKRERT